MIVYRFSTAPEHLALAHRPQPRRITVERKAATRLLPHRPHAELVLVSALVIIGEGLDLAGEESDARKGLGGVEDEVEYLGADWDVGHRGGGEEGWRDDVVAVEVDVREVSRLIDGA